MTEPIDKGQSGTQEETPAEQLRDELAKGLLYLHSRANTNTSKTLEIAAFAYALIELLSERGIIAIAELDERKKVVGQRLVELFAEKGMGVALTKDEQDKYSYHNEVRIDCENRVHLCRASCCRLRFALSIQDVEEGSVKWDLGHPYMIRQGFDGYCHHFERQTQGCGIYNSRPVVCRGYDCRDDKRIWLDFEKKIINPDLESIFEQAAQERRHGPRGDHGVEKRQAVTKAPVAEYVSSPYAAFCTRAV